MRYKLINKTDISNKTLHKIIKFVCPTGLNEFRITLKYSYESNFEGEAFGHKNSIFVSINRKISFPTSCNYKSSRRYGYIDNSMFKNKKEVLVSYFAHELRHLWQYNVSKQNFETRPMIMDWWNGETYQICYKREKDSSIYSRKTLLKWRKYECSR